MLNLQHIKSKLPEYTFNALGATSTLASIYGSYNGMSLIVDKPLAIAGSVGIGVVVFASVNALFNREAKWNVTPIALVLAIAAIIGSSETINLHAQHLQAEAAKVEQQSNNDKLDAKLAEQQQREDARKADIRNQMEAITNEIAALRTAATKRNDGLRVEISEQVKRNEADDNAIEGYNEQIEKHIRPTTNKANIRTAEKRIERRNLQIASINRKIDAANKKLDDAIEPLKAELKGLRAKLQSSTISIAPVATNTVDAPTTNTRLHSCLFDLFTVVFLLLKSWYRPEKDTTLLQEEAMTEKQRDQQSNDAIGDLFATEHYPVASSSLTSHETNSEPKAPAKTYTKEELAEELRKRTIVPNDNDAISGPMIVELCNEIKTPKTARKWLDELASEHIVQAFQNGKSGVVYRYPASVPGKLPAPLKVINGGVA